ncbi:lachesin-like [Photinus pyralis]|uniref:lachesin-like n=1 Tax=Photinus pyralis TaxID=7054 RepID=UPI0012671A87|nr:lachesin-like [Photinus pyralis]
MCLLQTKDCRPKQYGNSWAPGLQWAKRGEDDEIIGDMANEGIIEPSSSPWTSPVVIVKKKDGSPNFCVDYKPKKVILMKSGYWQVRLDPEHREKTAFSRGSGLWQIMPFGLCNVSATSQDVTLPPNIDDSFSSSDVIVREGANETLTCRATGSPQPSVKWKRDDNSKISINKTLTVSEWEGETLELTRISRLDMGAYLCIASNGVPPTVSKRIKVSVDFPPMLWIPHQLVGAPLAYSVTLECFTEAHPSSLNYWTREDGHMIHESRKYHTENIVGVPAYKTHMRLTINNIHQTDYGTYKCVAKNPRGETDGTIRLYTSSPPTTSPKPTTTETPSRMKDIWGNGDFNNSVYGNPSSLTVHFSDKGSKYQSNLNEIDKSEQKSGSEIDSKGAIYEWPSSEESSAGNYQGKPSTWTFIILLYLLLR